MKEKFAKVFKRYENNILKIRLIDYSPEKEVNYYKFIERQKEKEWTQVILNSKILLSLLSYYFANGEYQIGSVDLLEQSEISDDGFRINIDSLIEKTKEDRAYMQILMNELECLESEDCIEIRSVSLNKKVEDAHSLVNIRSNGIVKIDEKFFNNEKECLSKELERICK